MGKPAQQQENISLARFKRALFFPLYLFRLTPTWQDGTMSSGSLSQKTLLIPFPA